MNARIELSSSAGGDPNNRWWGEEDPAPLSAHSRKFDVLVPMSLGLGSDVEMAQLVAESCTRQYGDFIFADGNFWVFIDTMWHPIPEPALRRIIHKFDGATIGKAQTTRVKIKSSTVTGIIKECIAVASHPDFFESPAIGLNARNVVVTIDATGKISTHKHVPDDRHRFTIDAEYDPDADAYPPGDTLLRTLLDGSFLGDIDAPQKVDLVGEILGAAAYGMATHLPQPKAFIFHGETANNGKSQIAALMKKLLPPSAVSHIPLSAFSDEKRIVNLAGKAANVVEELSGQAISGENFKAAVTGQPIEGRDLYKSAMTFYPRALHLCTTNVLPNFNGGIDRGLQRRLVILPFNRVIPENEIVPDIADRIGETEMDLLVAFAVEGARRLVQNRAYTIPETAAAALKEWLLKEPVNAWFDDRYAIDPEKVYDWKSVRDLRDSFTQWCVEEGIPEKYRPSSEGFSMRLYRIPGLQKRRMPGGPQVSCLTRKP